MCKVLYPFTIDKSQHGRKVRSSGVKIGCHVSCSNLFIRYFETVPLVLFEVRATGWYERRITSRLLENMHCSRTLGRKVDKSDQYAWQSVGCNNSAPQQLTDCHASDKRDKITTECKLTNVDSIHVCMIHNNSNVHVWRESNDWWCRETKNALQEDVGKWPSMTATTWKRWLDAWWRTCCKCTHITVSNAVESGKMAQRNRRRKIRRCRRDSSRQVWQAESASTKQRRQPARRDLTMRQGNWYIELGISVSRWRRDMEGAQSNKSKSTNRNVHKCGTRVCTSWIAHADSNGFILRAQHHIYRYIKGGVGMAYLGRYVERRTLVEMTFAMLRHGYNT